MENVCSVSELVVSCLERNILIEEYIAKILKNKTIINKYHHLKFERLHNKKFIFHYIYNSNLEDPPVVREEYTLNELRNIKVIDKH